MKQTNTLLLLLLIGQFAMAQATIEVLVTKVKPGKGNIRVGLFNADNYMGTPVEGKEVVANSETVVLKFENVPDGEYALSVFHDANENSVLDKSKLGIPKEGFAFSNNVMGKKGPPTFEKARFMVKGTAGIRQVVNMRYP